MNTGIPLFFTPDEKVTASERPPLVKVNDAYEIKQLLTENESADALFNYSIRKEVFRFLKFRGTMLLAFPAGLIMRRLIRRNKRLNHILQFEELQAVRNNIEKGSFAYDTLLFKQSPLQIFQNKSHLANLVCLALLFGDEFIDGIAAEYGKENVQALLADPTRHYNLQYRNTPTGHELYYEFDIRQVLPPRVLFSINEKYKINYSEFYGHLQFLLCEINRHLNKLDAAAAPKAAALICSVCNKCFDTYKADVQGYTPGYDLTKLLSYQQSKDDDIIKILLQLRGTVLHKNKPKYENEFAGWACMVRSMQVYDDMQDAATDCGYQMNFLCYFARSFFTAEWNWLQANRQQLAALKGTALHQTLAVHMPAATMLCLQYNKNISHKNLGWVQLKIQNYLWRKNWLGFTETANEHEEPFVSIKEIKKVLFSQQHTLISDEMKYAHLVDIIMLSGRLREQLFSIITRRQRYFLKNCYTVYPGAQKVLLAKRFLALVR
jgi:hypothetical protein